MALRILIRNGIVLPMTGTKVSFDPGSVLVEGDTILAVGRSRRSMPTRVPPGPRSSTSRGML